MFVYTSKILGVFRDLVVLALLLVGAIALRRFRLGLAIASFLLLLVSGSGITSGWIVGSIEAQYTDRGIGALPASQAIVILGGSVHGPSGEHPASRILDSSDRLLVALRLYQYGFPFRCRCTLSMGRIGAETGTPDRQRERKRRTHGSSFLGWNESLLV